MWTPKKRTPNKPAKNPERGKANDHPVVHRTQHGPTAQTIKSHTAA